MKDQSDSPGDKSDDKQRHARSPLTVFKWVAVGTVVVLLAFVVAAKVAKFRSVRDSICCDCNLKQIGLSLRVFANDHSDKFPMQLSTNQGGTMEYFRVGEASGLLIERGQVVQFVFGSQCAHQLAEHFGVRLIFVVERAQGRFGVGKLVRVDLPARQEQSKASAVCSRSAR